MALDLSNKIVGEDETKAIQLIIEYDPESLFNGACVIVLNKGNGILLQLRKDDNWWGLAGGSLEC